MTLISYDAAFHIKDITTAHPSPCTPPSFPSLPFAPSEACPPLVLSPSSFGHERRETSAAPLPRRNLDLGAFAFSTLFQWMCERVTQVLSHWMALKNRHSANAPNKQALPLPPPTPKTPPPPQLHILSHSAGGTRGQSTLLVCIVKASTYSRICPEEKTGHRIFFLKYIIN